MLNWKLAAIVSLWSILHGSLASSAGEAGRLAGDAAQASSTPYFRITVVDEETGRGIPLVRLATTNRAEYWTDSAGVVAFWEPEMMGTQVQLEASTYGYSMRRNMFGQQAVNFIPRAGESLVVKMHRDMIAQRLYRLTGADIYRDSRMLGDTTPETQDPSPMPVTGMDSVATAVYRGKMYWIWGDTAVSATNLGNFRATGATSALPGPGGLDPEVGVYYTFFRNPDGRVRGMINTDHNLTWLGGMHVVRDGDGREHLFTHYAKIKPPLTAFENGLAKFNDSTNQFDIVWATPEDARLDPGANHFRHSDGGREYFYQDNPFPCIRCRADLDSIQDIYSYEGLTCLKPGSKFDASSGQLLRDGQGHLVWGWRRNTSAVGPAEMKKLIDAGLAGRADAPLALRDARTGSEVAPHGGSVYWNEHRQRWVACMLQHFGTSLLGEVWYFEGDTPVGPWVYGEKIITHTIFADAGRERRVDEAPPEAAETYAFYNVKHHPEFDREEGRVIYLEGTYTMTFSGAKHPTPRYDYNQVMYKLDLDDERLRLPVPVYRLVENGGGRNGLSGYYTKPDVPRGARLNELAIPFFAPDRPRKGTVPVYQVRQDQGVRLTLSKPEAPTDAAGAFFAAPPGGAADRGTVPLYEYADSQTGERFYSVRASLDPSEDPGDTVIDELPRDPGRFRRAQEPLCRVWPNPIRFHPYRLRP